jgi:hypothetical protein
LTALQRQIIHDWYWYPSGNGRLYFRIYKEEARQLRQSKTVSRSSRQKNAVLTAAHSGLGMVKGSKRI